MSKLKNWLPSLIVMAIIFAFSSLNGKVIHESGFGKETYQINAHFFLFIMLCFSYYKATKNVAKAVLLTIAYGILDELHQRYTPLRSSSLFDIFVDSSGALLVGVILWKKEFLLPKQLRNWLIS